MRVFTSLRRRTLAGVSLSLLTGAGLLTACSKDDVPADNSATVRTAAAAQYAELANAVYADSYNAALTLRTKLGALVSQPSTATLADAKAAYLAARTPYEQTEAFRFADGPIEDIEGEINSWPIDESYIDYTATNASSGIINTPATIISKDSLASYNQRGAEENVSTGYHAIEFLLWGQDLSTSGPGQRPYTDYVAPAGSTNSAQARRGQYLLAVADLLVDDLNQVLTQWKPGQNNYRQRFLAMPTDSSLSHILTGIGRFTKGELYGERMAAYNTRDQEDEQSCFSDQTHNDFVLGQLGIDNVYNGRYTTMAGTQLSASSLSAVIRARSTTADDNLLAALAASRTAVADIAAHAPYDQEILNQAGLARVLTARTAGGQQATRILEAAQAAGIKVTL